MLVDQPTRNGPYTHPKLGRDARSRGARDDHVGDISLFCCMSSAKATSVTFRAGRGSFLGSRDSAALATTRDRASASEKGLN
jgi:hypothetical protein